MSSLTWRLLAITLTFYLVVVPAGYRFFWEPTPSVWIAIEEAVGSLLGGGPMPLPVQQQGNFALMFDMMAILAGFASASN